MTIGAVITNYYSWPLAEFAISQVIRWCSAEISRIIVVDDASDAPVKLDAQPGVLIERNLENVGYVRSVNLGLAQMTEDIVLLLDSDAYPVMNLVPDVRRHFEESPRLGALGFSVVVESGSRGIAAEREPTVGYFVAGQKIGDALRRRGWFAGKRLVLHSCCIAVRRKAFAEIGGFDPSFDFLDADIDFSLRLQNAGWSVEVDPKLQCFHRGHGSPQTTSQRVIRFHQNRWKLLCKHQHVRLPQLLKSLLFVRHTVECLVLWLLGLGRFLGEDDFSRKLNDRRELLRRVWKGYR